LAPTAPIDSLLDEHLWRPTLYIDPQKLEQRFEHLKKGHFSVLPLGEGFQRLSAGTLPPRSVALTFDDGFFDFFRQAYPLLKQYGFPATVYQTTYYTSVERPIFNLICSYLLWKRRGEVIGGGESMGLQGRLDLRTDSSRSAVLRTLLELSEHDNRTGLEKDESAAQLARVLKVDYDELKAKRILQLMNGRELQEITSNGIDVQLHTHRHRTPEDEALFRKEIQDNRSTIQKLTATQPVHFCYPSGVYRPAFLPWLRKEHVVTATTCDVGLAARQSESLLLPRYIDHQNRTQVEFESWVTGVGDLLAVRRKAAQDYVSGRG
jgi:peptidoglycan/xylan/chitin deacetylase (PgdA/CDA1 family)